MFPALAEKLRGVIGKLSKTRHLTEENIQEAIREVRLALLDADVAYPVAKVFIQKVKEKALGTQLIKTVSPAQQFTKIVHDELVALMGSEESKLDLKGKMPIIMLCGLQGSGKTTQSAKLAKLFTKPPYQFRPLLVACDLQRLAAVEQLKTLGSQIGVPVFTLEKETSPVKVAQKAKTFAENSGYNLLILDTAGRLHIDEELMKELKKMKQEIKPDHILFVASAATGQDAVNTAKAFNDQIEITGTILTMLDGSARGGAAISIREITHKPLFFEGVGERMEDIQEFNPVSMADRVLGMGDTINLVKKAQEHFDAEEKEAIERKLKKAEITYSDYLKQMGMIRKMGSVKSLLKMIPGMSQMSDMDISEEQLKKVEAIILSMTLEERTGEEEISFNRRKRIATGSGTRLDDVNRLVKAFKQMKQMLKQLPKMKMLNQLMGGHAWH